MKQENMLVSIFLLCLFVMAINLMTLAVGWVNYQQRAALFSQVVQLQERIVALEATQERRQQARQQR